MYLQVNGLVWWESGQILVLSSFTLKGSGKQYIERCAAEPGYSWALLNTENLPSTGALGVRHLVFLSLQTILDTFYNLKSPSTAVCTWKGFTSLARQPSWS